MSPSSLCLWNCRRLDWRCPFPACSSQDESNDKIISNMSQTSDTALTSETESSAEYKLRSTVVGAL
jgi:hypothetical protein